MISFSTRLLIGCFLLVALTLPAQAARIVWHGVWTQNRSFDVPEAIDTLAHRYLSEKSVHSTYVQERDAQGKWRWVSRDITWNVKVRVIAPGYEKWTCDGGGSINLGPSEYGVDYVTDAQRKRMKIPCKHEKLSKAIYFKFITTPDTGVRIPGIVGWDRLREGCSYSEEGRDYTYSVWVSPELDAVMDVKSDKGSEYWNFAPVPGKKITFSAKANIPSFFRFKLLEVSHFPGYATNADIDDAFFKRSHLEHLNGKYQNDSPDLIFDPKDFQGDFWKKPGGDFEETVETAKTGMGATVMVTAMDFGAYGYLIAEAKGQCGGWEPVKIRVNGREKDFLTIPLDEDKNLIADKMETYKGDPGRDDDSEPKGDGTPGDGLTAFEEYRGLMTMGDNCQDNSKGVYVRTNPARKDLFIHSDDPMLGRMAILLSDSSKLDVHLICLHQYVDDKTRIVNFTLQNSGLKKWAGKTVSQDSPQHGIYLINAKLEGGTDGITEPRLGPPKYVQVVKVDKRKCLANGNKLGPLQLARVVIHELGHAIAIEHHGDGNIEKPIVILDAGSCPKGTIQGSVDGKVACKVDWIAVQHGQNSGEQTCPMKYIWWSWYVPPSSSLNYVGEVEFKRGILHKSEKLPGYKGRLRLYRSDIDTPGLGEFSSSKKGTGINGLPGDENHAGDAERICSEEIHVNDVNEW